MILRAEQPDDIEAIDRVNRLAFDGPDEAVLVDRLRDSDAFIPELSIVAEEEGAIVGHIMFTRLQLNPPTTVRVISLAPMAVLPGSQRKGIGSAMVLHGLEVAREMGEELVVVIGHPDYYPRFGFTPASRLGLASPFPAPDDAFLTLSLRAGPTPSGMLVYPAPFEAPEPPPIRIRTGGRTEAPERSRMGRSPRRS